MEDRMKNWEIMAVLESRQGDSKNWACPSLRAWNKRTRLSWPFKSDFPRTRETRRSPRLAKPGPPYTSTASPSFSPGSPGDWLGLETRGERRAKDILSDWPARSGVSHVLGDVSRQFRLVSRSPPRGRSLLPSELFEPANCCRADLGSDGT